MPSAQEVLASLPKPKRRGGKKSRKHGRNYRWDGVSHSMTKYRARHGIGPGPRKRK
jgi:hypothetical protein